MDTAAPAIRSLLPRMCLVEKAGSSHWPMPGPPVTSHRLPILCHPLPTAPGLSTNWYGYSYHRRPDGIIGAQTGRRTGWTRRVTKSVTIPPGIQCPVSPGPGCSDCLPARCQIHHCSRAASTRLLAWEDVLHPQTMDRYCWVRRSLPPTMRRWSHRSAHKRRLLCGIGSSMARIFPL